MSPRLLALCILLAGPAAAEPVEPTAQDIRFPPVDRAAMIESLDSLAARGLLQTPLPLGPLAEVPASEPARTAHAYLRITLARDGQPRSADGGPLALRPPEGDPTADPGWRPLVEIRPDVPARAVAALLDQMAAAGIGPTTFLVFGPDAKRAHVSPIPARTQRVRALLDRIDDPGVKQDVFSELLWSSAGHCQPLAMTLSTLMDTYIQPDVRARITINSLKGALEGCPLQAVAAFTADLSTLTRPEQPSILSAILARDAKPLVVAPDMPWSALAPRVHAHEGPLRLVVKPER